MKIKLTAYGIARDILESRNIEFECKSGTTIGSLMEELTQAYPLLANLTSVAFAVNEEYAQLDYHIQPGDQIVIIPPVSGG